MNVYRLDPMIRDDPRWEASSVADLLFVGAETAGEARILAANKTARLTPKVKSAPKMQSPWLDEKLTSCVWDTSKSDVPHGAVVTADGARLP